MLCFILQCVRFYPNSLENARLFFQLYFVYNLQFNQSKTMKSLVFAEFSHFHKCCVGAFETSASLHCDIQAWPNGIHNMTHSKQAGYTLIFPFHPKKTCGMQVRESDVSIDKLESYTADYFRQTEKTFTHFVKLSLSLLKMHFTSDWDIKQL